MYNLICFPGLIKDQNPEKEIQDKISNFYEIKELDLAGTIIDQSKEELKRFLIIMPAPIIKNCWISRVRQLCDEEYKMREDLEKLEKFDEYINIIKEKTVKRERFEILQLNLELFDIVKEIDRRGLIYG